MKTKTILLCSVTLTLGACSYNDMNTNSGPRYMPRLDAAHTQNSPDTRVEDDMDVISYKQYEGREPCQSYRKPPRHFSDGCVTAEMEEIVAVAEEPALSPKPVVQKPLLPVVRSYTVLFDFDKSNVRTNETATLDQAMNEIGTYKPEQVTVTGYTDSSGARDYNEMLSHEREQAVSSDLLKRGIKNDILNREARGESDQAVETADGVKMQENRRVVIDFRR